MSNRRRRRLALSEEQEQERFSTDGKGFLESLRLVVAGGSDDKHTAQADDEREAGNE